MYQSTVIRHINLVFRASPVQIIQILCRVELNFVRDSIATQSGACIDLHVNQEIFLRVYHYLLFT